MYCVQQMQGLDYVLKRILRNSDYSGLHKRDLQLVVDIDGKLWRGNFVMTSDSTGAVMQRDYNSQTGRNEIKSYDIATSPILKNAFEAHLETIPDKSFYTNPYEGMLETHTLYYYLIKTLESMEVDESMKLDFYPYLYDAVSLDGNYELPFLDVSGKELDIVSIHEVFKAEKE